MIAMKVENLVKRFGKGSNSVSVIDGANFSLNKGEFVGLVAPSGAGKTTLLLMLGWGATLKTLNLPFYLNKALSNHLSMPHQVIPSLIPSTFS